MESGIDPFRYGRSWYGDSVLRIEAIYSIQIASKKENTIDSNHKNQISKAGEDCIEIDERNLLGYSPKSEVIP